MKKQMKKETKEQIMLNISYDIQNHVNEVDDVFVFYKAGYCSLMVFENVSTLFDDTIDYPKDYLDRFLDPIFPIKLSMAEHSDSYKNWFGKIKYKTRYRLQLEFLDGWNYSDLYEICKCAVEFRKQAKKNSDLQRQIDIDNFFLQRDTQQIEDFYKR